eukprot:TRINITY_DN11409_c0_g1_i5.p1 TRINITY_DN11409_c0_g1~~TRINITY_DN11409_c0_g1_i5.p1  ORF type:complete len:280 (+),score=53.64 TRINITY_DN11409_c0_g1_i5:249-1088(+)
MNASGVQVLMSASNLDRFSPAWLSLCDLDTLIAYSSIIDNVCYNGPRAQLNINDGFWGANWIEGNVLFNGVRETGDHGNFNSWDRQVWLVANGVDDGYDASVHPPGLSVIRAQDTVVRNIILNGYNGVWTIDHDDGSQFYTDTHNVMLWGGCKNYLGHSKDCVNNFILYPGCSSRSTGEYACQTDDSGDFANSFFMNNHCITNKGVTYNSRSCDQPILQHYYHTANNTFYSTNSTWSFPQCKLDNLTSWQATGQDPLTTVNRVPEIDDMIDLAASTLGM